MESPSPLPVIRTSLEGLAWRGQSLRAGAEKVDFDCVPHAQRRAIATGLVRALYGERAASGLAAPMVGIGLRMIVATDAGRVLLMANPEIVAASAESIETREANISLPGVSARVRRAATVTVRWRSGYTGQDRQEAFDGWLARVIQHEMDLLEGRMFTDHVEPSAVRREWPSVEARAADATVAVFDDRPRTAPEVKLPALDIVGIPMALTTLQASVLRRPNAPVDLERAALRALIEAMFAAQYRRNGVGLAADRHERSPGGHRHARGITHGAHQPRDPGVVRRE